MKNGILLKTAAVMFACTALPTADLRAYDEELPIIELSATEDVKVAPDLAILTTGVQTKALTASEAMQRNAQSMSAVIAQIKAAGVAAKDIQTNRVSLDRDYEYDQKLSRNVFIGYVATNNVTVTMRDLSLIGRVIDTATNAGATDISGPSFQLENAARATYDARQLAMKSLDKQAAQYAAWAGFRSYRLLAANEGGGAPPAPMPKMALRMMADAASASDTPIISGQVAQSVTISARFVLIR